jgi:hypothetical protein
MKRIFIPSSLASCLLTLLILSAIASCQQSSQPLTASEQKEMIDTIRHTMENYHRDIRTSGLTAEFKYLDSSAEFFWIPPGYAEPIPFDSVASALRESAPFLQSINNSFDSLRIIPVSREVATYIARISSTITDTTGESSSFKLFETGVLIKRSNGWKLLCGQTTISNPE